MQQYLTKSFDKNIFGFICRFIEISGYSFHANRFKVPLKAKFYLSEQNAPEPILVNFETVMPTITSEPIVSPVYVAYHSSFMWSLENKNLFNLDASSSNINQKSFESAAESRLISSTLETISYNITCKNKPNIEN